MVLYYDRCTEFILPIDKQFLSQTDQTQSHLATTLKPRLGLVLTLSTAQTKLLKTRNTSS